MLNLMAPTFLAFCHCGILYHITKMKPLNGYENDIFLQRIIFLELFEIFNIFRQESSLFMA